MKPSILLTIILLYFTDIYPQSLETRLDSLLKGYVDKGMIHGCLVYISQNNKTTLFKPYGYMDVEKKRLMEKDAIFRIASMTKPLTAAAALQLYEDGKFLLDDPVKKYIPEFGDLRVLSPECKSVDSLITVPLERDVTIRDLFIHTAGFGYGGNDIVGKLYEKNITRNENLTIKKFVKEILSVPLKYQPGSKWEYSFANDILGYLIEVISGKPLDEYMYEALFEPLDMEDTGFLVDLKKRNRLCNFYTYNNKLTLVENAKNSTWLYKPVFLSGGGGGVSTAEDYAKFCRMLLNYGSYEGKQILDSTTVKIMTSDQIKEIKDRSFPLEGYGFGIGLLPGNDNSSVKPSYWAGSPYNTTFVIDFNKQMIAILLIQNGPWTHLDIMEKFRRIVRQGTIE